MDFLEKRKAPRFQGKLAVEFERGKGVTCDFSTSGVFFETEQSFSAGDPIEFFLNLEHTGLGAQVRVRCLGEIVRVKPIREKTGVAVAIISFGFEGPRDPGQRR